MVDIRDEIISKKLKENISFSSLKLNSNDGRQRLRTQIIPTFTTSWDICCAAIAQYPKPVIAIVIVMMALTIIPDSSAMAISLKRSWRVSMMFGIMNSELMIMARNSMRAKEMSGGMLK